MRMILLVRDSGILINMIGNSHTCYLCSSEVGFKGCVCNSNIKLIGKNCLAYHISDKNIDHNLIEIDLALRMQTDPSFINLYIDDFSNINKASEFLRESLEKIKSYKTLLEGSKIKIISHIEETFSSLNRTIEEINYEINTKIKWLDDYKTSLCEEGRVLINEFKAKKSRGLLENTLKSLDIHTDEILRFITNSIKLEFTNTTIESQSIGKLIHSKPPPEEKDWAIEESSKPISEENQGRYRNYELFDQSDQSMKINEKDQLINQSTISKQHYSLKEYKSTFKIRRNTDRVFSLCMSVDGRWIVTGGEDRTVRIWNIETKLQEAEFTGHISWVFSVCISRNGKWITSGGNDNTVRIWSVERKSEEAVFIGHQGGVFSVSMSRNDCWIISGSGDNTVMVWNMINKTQEAVLIGHTDCVLCVCMSDDDKWILSGGRDNTLRIWSMENKSQEAVLTGHTNWVNSVCSVPDGRRIISGSSDNTVRIWNIVNKVQERVLTGHSDIVTSVCMSGCGKWILSASKDSKVIIWNMLSKYQEAILTEDSSGVLSVCISGDSRYIASSSGDNTLIIWS
jgi:WD40 repeat protein